MIIEDLIADFRKDVAELEKHACEYDQMAANCRRKAAQMKAGAEYLVKQAVSANTHQ